MAVDPTTEAWSLRTACFCLLLGLVAAWAGLALASAADVAWLGAESFDLFRRGPAATLIAYLASRVLALGVCLYLAGIRRPEALLTRFALRRPSAKYVVIAVVSGLWIAVFVQSFYPGRLSSLRLQTSLGAGTVALLVAPVLEEMMVRGFFYPTFRNVFGVPLSIAFVLGIDAVLFHPAVLRVYEGLPAVAVVNVAACLLREGARNTWPCIGFHVAYCAFYAFFVW